MQSNWYFRCHYQCYYPKDKIDIVKLCILNHSSKRKEYRTTIEEQILVDADAHGHIRAYCDNPHCHFEYNDGRLNAKATIGDRGFINVIRDLKLKEPFIGSTPIISGEIAEDFAYYYQVSEQVPSAVGLGVLVDTENKAVASGGFIIQLLPDTPEEVILKLEEKLKMIPTVSEMLSSGYTPEDIIFNIADDVEIIESVDVEFRCNCSKERFERVTELARRFGIYDSLKDRIQTYSHGMKQKLALISAIIRKPKLLILDEPLVGLDPKASFQIKEIMKEMCEEGTSIFFSTHVLEVAEKICDRVAIIKDGKIVACGAMDEIKGDKSLEAVFMELIDE